MYYKILFILIAYIPNFIYYKIFIPLVKLVVEFNFNWIFYYTK